MTEPWWRGAVFYQIYPRSFADADGDGVGDLRGITDHVDHLVALGVDAVWLSPFYRSPMADFGYDVADYCDVDPRFGTLADFDQLVGALHGAGIRVIIDFVPNHSSDEHPWFVASRSSRDDPKRDWYYWRDGGADGGPPNNWRASFTGDGAWVRDDSGQLRPRYGLRAPDGVDTSAWTFDDATDQWYLHTFLARQPDLDWRNPAVAEAMHGAMRFWLDRGADGFRVDAISSVGKPIGLPDADERMAMLPHAGLTDDAFALDVIRSLRAVVDEYDDRMLVGEVGGVDVPSIMRHVGADRFHLAFNFPPMYDRWRADRWRRHIEASEAHGTGETFPAWVLSNHDAPRHADRYGSQARARAAAVLLLTLRGTAFLYMGEELGLIDAEVPPDQQVDPGGRDGERAPLPWTADEDHGWTGARPWLPFPRNAGTHDAATQADDPASMLALYRALLAARRASPALCTGDFTWLEAPSTVLAYRRSATEAGEASADAATVRDDRVALVNFDATPAHVPVAGRWVIEVDSAMREAGRPWDGHLDGDRAVVLRPVNDDGQ